MSSQGYDPNADSRDEAGSEITPSTLEQIVRKGAKRMHETKEQWRRAGRAERGTDYDNEFAKNMRWLEFSDGKGRAIISGATRWINAKAVDGSAEAALEEDIEQREELQHEVFAGA